MQNLENSLTPNEKREQEESLSQFVEENRNSVFVYSAAIQLSRDPFMKVYYAGKMMELIRGRGDVMSYTKGIFVTHHLGDIDRNRRLADEMIEKHPILGRIIKFDFSYLPPACFFNIFD